MTPPKSSVPRRATLVTTATSFSLAVLKTIVGILSGSIAVLASAVDSFLDFIISLFNAITVRVADKPRDAEHNYGHGKLEGIAALFESVLILGSAGFILYKAIGKIVEPVPLDSSGLNLAVGAMVVSMLVSAALVLYLRAASRKSRSLVLEADALHYRMDVWANAGVLLGMLIILASGWELADPLLAIFVGLYIMREAIPLLRKAYDMLMDRALHDGLVEKIEEIAMTHSPLVNGMHELKTRRSGEVNFVEFHLVFNEHMPLGKAHRVADEIEMRIRGLEKGRWSINIHLDPVDDSHMDRKLEEGLR